MFWQCLVFSPTFGTFPCLSLDALPVPHLPLYLRMRKQRTGNSQPNSLFPLLWGQLWDMFHSHLTDSQLLPATWLNSSLIIAFHLPQTLPLAQVGSCAIFWALILCLQTPTETKEKGRQDLVHWSKTITHNEAIVQERQWNHVQRPGLECWIESCCSPVTRLGCDSP